MRSRTDKNFNTPKKECQEHGEVVRRNVSAIKLSSLRPENLVCPDWNEKRMGGFEKGTPWSMMAVYPTW